MQLEEEQPRLPASIAVRDELVKLRKGTGLSEDRLRECPLLCALPATQHELERRGFDRSDAHIAAYQMIKCAVRSFLPATETYEIVRTALNLDESADGLEQRRKGLERRLSYGASLIRRREASGFTQLANRILAAQESPCAEQPPGGKTTTFEIRIETTSASLVEALRLMTMEGRYLPLDNLGLKVLIAGRNLLNFFDIDLLPLNEHPGRLWTYAITVLDLVIDARWPSEEDPARRAAAERVLSAATMQSLLTTRTANSRDHMDIVQRNAAAVESAARPHLPVLIAGGQLTDAFFERRDAGLKLLATEYRTIDSFDRWADLVKPAKVEQMKRALTRVG